MIIESFITKTEIINQKGDRMVGVNVSNYENFDAALKAFRSKVRKAHIIELINRKSHYISPSERRHRSKLKKKISA